MPDEKYCYPNTNILKNKLNIRDKQTLLQAEIELTSKRLQQLQEKPMKGNFDFHHLCNIHKHIFQDLYDWAGKPRTVAIAKGSLFCLPQHIQSYAGTIFPNYYKDCNHVKDNQKELIKILAAYYADLNALHPFREGNGRAQREFTRELCRQCGYAFDLRFTTHEQMLNASIESLDKGDNKPLEEIFQKAINPLDENNE